MLHEKILFNHIISFFCMSPGIAALAQGTIRNSTTSIVKAFLNSENDSIRIVPLANDSCGIENLTKGMFSDSETVNDKQRINNLCFELFGQGVRYSLNYERVFCNKTPSVFRSGLSYYIQPSFSSISGPQGTWKEPDFHILTVPLSFSLLFGKKKGFLETGMGVTWVDMMQVGYAPSFILNSNIIIGYRRQVTQGVLFKKFYSPFIVLYTDTSFEGPYLSIFPIVPIWGGISVGYSFSRKSKP